MSDGRYSYRRHLFLVIEAEGVEGDLELGTGADEGRGDGLETAEPLELDGYQLLLLARH